MALYRPSLSPIRMSAVFIAAPISPTAFIMNSCSFSSFTGCGAAEDMRNLLVGSEPGVPSEIVLSLSLRDRTSQSPKLMQLLLTSCYPRSGADNFLHFGDRANCSGCLFALGWFVLVSPGAAAPGLARRVLCAHDGADLSLQGK